MENHLFFIITSIFILFIIYFLSKKYFIFKNILISLYIVTMTIYIVWRILYTLPHGSAISVLLGLSLLIAEIGSFVLSITFYFLFCFILILKYNF